MPTKGAPGSSFWSVPSNEADVITTANTGVCLPVDGNISVTVPETPTSTNPPTAILTTLVKVEE